MNRYKATLLLALCLACALLFTSCHTNNDPWPASSAGAGAGSESITAAPDAPTEPPAVATDTLEPSPTPVVTVAPGVNG